MSQASSATLGFSIVIPAHDEAENLAPYLEERNPHLIIRQRRREESEG